LTSSRLKLHEKTQAAIQGLKEGHLSEAAFRQEISNKDRETLWKKYEGARNKDPEAKAAWLQMGGPGVLDKKKQLLLHFLRTGQAVEQWLERKPKAQNHPSLASWRWRRIFHRHLNILNDIHLGSHTLCSSKPERRPRGNASQPQHG